MLEKSFAYPQLILQRLKSERRQGFAMVPTIAAMLLQQRNLKPGDLPDLRYVTNAAAALAPATLLRLQDLLNTTRIYSMYGQTECTRTCYLPPEQVHRRPASVGIPIPNCEVFIVDESGREVGPDVVGELVVRGGHVMAGYWEHPLKPSALRPLPQISTSFCTSPAEQRPLLRRPVPPR